MRRVRNTFIFTLFLLFIAIWFAVGLKKPHRYEGFAFSTDTAIATEAHFIRHRSMTDLYEVFGLGPGLLPYFASDYIWAPPPYINAYEELR